MGFAIIDGLMVAVGAGSMLLGMVFGMIDTALRFKGWLRRIAESASERR